MSIPPPETAPNPQAPYGYYPAPQVPEQPQGKNGFAIASLIFGIIGGILFGLIFGFIGLSRAKKVNRGKAMSWIGIVLSILWIAPIAYFVPHLLKASDAGCVAAKQTISTYDDAKFNADQSDPAALKADFQAVTDRLNDAAAKSQNSAAKTAIQSVANDFKELVTDLDTNTVPSSDLQARMNTDGKKIDSACGTIGS